MSTVRRFVAGHSEGLLYVAAAVTYVVAGMYEKGLLNWIAGPAWLVAWVWLVPAGWRRLRGTPATTRPERP